METLMKSGSGARYSGYLKMHWSWSVYLALSLFALTAGMFFIDRRAGMICLVFSCAYFVVILLIYLYYRPKILQALIMFAGRYGEIQAAVLRELESCRRCAGQRERICCRPCREWGLYSLHFLLRIHTAAVCFVAIMYHSSDAVSIKKL